ncbi:MAG: gamma-glutamyltransferase [Alphaproteobacteria bacterium]|jgi:gamma-glutamyltranspeptidase/glutathione hydrolase
MFTAESAPGLIDLKVRERSHWRQITILAVSLLSTAVLAACGDERSVGTPGFVQGFAGAVVADEPHAALAGRDLLAAGGTAGDAAASVFFTLAVTKPASAGLMASGLCLGFDPRRDQHKAYRFDAPAGVRAMAAIHARFGSLPWAQVIATAENFARSGFRASKALTEDWRAAPPTDSEAIAIYGQQPQIGDQVENLALAGLLGQIRQGGAGAFYVGKAGKQVWDTMAANGLNVDQSLWRKSVPIAADSKLLKFGNHQIAFAGFNNTSGATQIAIWPKLREQGTEALPTILQAAGATADETAIHETSFVAVDRFGGAVACTLSMGQPYGIGQMVSGIFLARPAKPSTGPVIVANKPTKSFLGAYAGSGVPGWTSAVALDTVDDKKQLTAQIQAPRAAPSSQGGFVTESGASVAGGTTRTVARLGRVNGVHCVQGLPNFPNTCQAVSDPRGHGLAAIADPQR